MTLIEQRDVIQAAIDGKKIQYRFNGLRWADWLESYGRFNFKDYTYRVKPEPREWWITLDEREPELTNGWWAGIARSKPHSRPPSIKVREVLE